jgi:DNA ligase-1
MPVFDIILEIRSTNSKKEKIEIIKKHKDNEVLTRVFQYALDPLVTFGIKKIPEYESLTDVELLARTNHNLNGSFDVLESLIARQYTGNAAIQLLTEELFLLHEAGNRDDLVLILIINKDLKAGISFKSVNEAYGFPLIEEYPISKCGKWNEKTKKKMKYPAFSQVKMDSIRCNAFIYPDCVTWKTGAGQELNIVNENINSELLFMNIPNNVLDGELLISDGKGGFLSRKESAGILLKLQTNTITPEEEEMVRFVVWDKISFEDFFRGHEKKFKSSKKYEFIYDELRVLLTQIMFDEVKDEHVVVPRFKYTQLVETEISFNEDDAINFYKRQRSLNREGSIIKNFDHVWRNGRDDDTLKLKAEISVDLIITNVIESSVFNLGRLKTDENIIVDLNTLPREINKRLVTIDDCVKLRSLGSFEVTNKDGSIKCNVGSGFSFKQRVDYFNEDLIGRVCEITYNEIITNKDSETLSLFLPIFKILRFDKDVDDID